MFIGRVHFKKGNYKAAQDCYNRAHILLNGAGDLRWVSIVLEDLGDLALEPVFFVEGLERFQEAPPRERQRVTSPVRSTC